MKVLASKNAKEQLHSLKARIYTTAGQAGLTTPRQSHKNYSVLTSGCVLLQVTPHSVKLFSGCALPWDGK